MISPISVDCPTCGANRHGDGITGRACCEPSGPNPCVVLGYYHAARVDKAADETRDMLTSMLGRIRELERTVAEHDAKIGAREWMERARREAEQVRSGAALVRPCQECGAAPGEPCFRTEKTISGVTRGEVMDGVHRRRLEVATPLIAAMDSRAGIQAVKEHLQPRGGCPECGRNDDPPANESPRQRLDRLARDAPASVAELNAAKELLGQVQKALGEALQHWEGALPTTIDSGNAEYVNSSRVRIAELRKLVSA